MTFVNDLPPETVELASDVRVLVRGWLHANSVLVGDVLVDTGYHSGIDILRRWLLSHLGRDTPTAIVLTHAHSDHAGGVAHLSPASGPPVWASRATQALVTCWDETGLWLGDSGQQMPRFEVHRPFDHDDIIEIDHRRWRVIATPGHMRSAVALHDEAHGILLTGDALWEHGFGMLDPWIEGQDCLDQASATLEALGGLDAVRVIVPGHGRPFTDLTSAIARARARLDAVRRNPDSVRRMVALGGVAFLSLARPELDRDALRDLVLRAVRAHPAGPPSGMTAEELVEAAFTAVAVRPAVH